jgi:outer membrane protein
VHIERPTASRLAGIFLVCLLLATPFAANAQAPLNGEISLEEAIELAHRFNPDYRTQEAQGDRTSWAIREAWGGFLPSANVSTGLGYSAPGERRFESVQLATQPGTYSSRYSIGLQYSMNGATLLRPGLVRDQNRATMARIDGASAGLVDQVTQAYLSVAQADAEVVQAETQLERTRTYVRQARAQVEVGAGTPLDIRRAEVQEGQAEVQLLQVRNQAVTSRLALGRVLGVPVDEHLEVTTTFEVFDDTAVDIDALLDRALDNNPVLRASRSQAEAVRTQSRIARSQYFPSLSLSANWSGNIFQPTSLDQLILDRMNQLGGQYDNCLYDNRIRDLLGDAPRNCAPLDPTDPAVEASAIERIEQQNSGWPFSYNRQPLSLSLSLSLPLFNGFSRELQLQEAKIAQRAARETVRSEELRLGSEVEAAVRAVRTARRTVELQARILSIAAEELRLANERFRLGLASSIEVIDAQANVAQAERDEISAIYQFHRAFASLEALVGEPIR